MISCLWLKEGGVLLYRNRSSPFLKVHHGGNQQGVPGGIFLRSHTIITAHLRGDKSSYYGGLKVTTL